MTGIGNILGAYSLILAAAIILFIFAIGRLYQLNFGKKTYYKWFLIPATLFILYGVMCALGRDWHVVGFVGAVLSLVLTVILYKIMMRVEK
jgi:Kef-type K+ transport system membrane component KefB